ncbi:hypothetical protein Mapa_000097 [Marchantia paleacea]|nr:hypothetical protein Mapa_000097 [Marchantia paleacea]
MDLLKLRETLSENDKSALWSGEDGLSLWISSNLTPGSRATSKWTSPGTKAATRKTAT